MKELLKLLLMFLRPGIEGDDDPNLSLELDEVIDNEEANEDTQQASGDEDEEIAEKVDHAALIAAEKDAAKKAADKADRLERELDELRRTQTAKPSADDEIFRQEESVLADPNKTDLEKWQVRANRELRAGRQAAARSEMNSQDVLDKSNFVMKCQENSRFLRVRDDVEKELSTMRSKGQNAPREVIAYVLLGKLVADAPVKKSAKKTSDVNRGKLPGARSDVAGKNAMNEHQKRTKRLENLPI